MPLRTVMTTTESWAMPLYFCLSQSGATWPDSTRRIMSPPWAKWTTEAGWPASTARLWSPEAPKELLKLTPAPSGVASKPGSSASS